MNRSGMRRVGLAAVVAGLAAAAGAGAWLRADDKPAAKADVGKLMVGAWRQAGTPDNPEEPPAKGGKLKVFTGKHWSVTQIDGETGRVEFVIGGTYKLDGAEYTETVEYATDNFGEQIGKTFTFAVKVDKDTYTQVGVGNDYNEAYRRAK